jgi:hypothetical protein
VGDPTVKNQWGVLVNTDMALIEAAITGLSSVALAGASTYTLTASNGATDQSRPFALLFSGANSGGTTVTIPSVARFGFAKNTSAYPVILTTGSGTTLTLPASMTSYVFYQCDGTNVTVPFTALRGKQVFQSPSGGSSTWVVPAGVGAVKLSAWGSGGGGGYGGGTSGGSGAGGGGGGGAYAEGVFAVSAGQTLTATYGAPGAGGISSAASGSGTASSWASTGITLSAGGGIGGALGFSGSTIYQNAGSPGTSFNVSGSALIGSQLTASGGYGESGLAVNGGYGVGGRGGSAFMSNGCAAVVSNTASTSATGISAGSSTSAYDTGQIGAGGGGGVGTGNGGAGGSGACAVEW